jgi:hypothetical protein
MKQVSVVVIGIMLAACGEDESAQQGTCTARALIAFYSDSACTAMVGMRSYDTAQECFSWTAPGSSAMENSATRFQCYADRVCYTQHPNTLDCTDGGFGQTDKQAILGMCLKEPDGQLYSKLLSGTEACPPAPAGFECPTSASMQGTVEAAVCTTQQ